MEIPRYLLGLLVVLVASLAGCARTPEGGGGMAASLPSSADAPAVDATPVSGRGPPPAAADNANSGTGAAPGGRWHLRESDPPVAAWGVPDSEGMLTFACDRSAGQLIMERHAIGVADSVHMVAIDADGTRMDYPAERVDAVLAPNLVTRIALDAPILDRLLTARRVGVIAGGDAVVTTAPGEALQAVLDACLRAVDEAPPTGYARAARMLSSERGLANR